MLHSFHSQTHLPRNKFSYATAQEYCELVKKSVDRVKNQHRTSRSPIIFPPAPLPKGNQYQSKLLRHEKLLLRIGERSRSRSNSCQGSTQQSSSVSRRQKTHFNMDCNSKLYQTPQLLKKPISNYEREHLLITLERQNAELKQVIGDNQAKIQKVKAKLAEQRKSQHIQRQLYEQYISKLKDTLQLQISSKTQSASSQECSLAGNISEELSDKSK